MNSFPANIYFTEDPQQTLKNCLAQFNPDKVAILVDENSFNYCLPFFADIENLQVIEIESGEKNKIIDTCSFIWEQLTAMGSTRKSVLINLGGGVIGDMGGFAAATYKRGIRFINIPTTLLSQVDASIGGKLGIDFNGLKNHIGVFQDPDAIILSQNFLKTLPIRQLKSGFAEAIKHGLIYDESYWQEIREKPFALNLDWNLLLEKSVMIKSDVVKKDPHEKGLRKILNFGHTLGHAIETWHLETHRDLLHGEAVAAGMILEAQMAYELKLIEKKHFEDIISYIDSVFERIATFPTFERIKSLLSQDKKNQGAMVMFSLINGPGSCLFDIVVNDDDILNAIQFYQSYKTKN
jgi:3-dehydroquinate synthase